MPDEKEGLRQLQFLAFLKSLLKNSPETPAELKASGVQTSLTAQICGVDSDVGVMFPFPLVMTSTPLGLRSS